MYLYNISVIIEENYQNKVIEWLNSESLKKEIGSFQLLKMLDSPHPGTTICVQIQFETAQMVDDFKNNQLTKMYAYVQQNYFEKVFLFDSVMKYLPNE